MGEVVTCRLRITGRVQGVGYRAWCVGEATRLGLSGWVRNRRDGSVEALVQGLDPAVAKLTDLCRQGPGFAAVSSVEAARSESDLMLPHGFSQVATV